MCDGALSLSPRKRFVREEVKKRSLPSLSLLCLTVVTVPTGVLNQIPSTSSSAFELGEVWRSTLKKALEERQTVK
jgi:hypothetical protein